MTLAQLLDDARSYGLQLRADDGRLVIRGPGELDDLARLLLARKTEVLAELAGATCCGRCPPGVADAPLATACKLCPASPTYWRGPA